MGRAFVALALLLFASGLSFADVQPVNMSFAAMAILLALGVLALGYMASYVFDQPHLRGIIQDEMVHLIATAIVLLSLVSLTIALNNTHIPGLLGAAGGQIGGATLGEQAIAELQGINSALAGAFNNLKALNENIGRTASKSVYCNFLGAGYSLVSCSTLNMLRGSGVQAMIALGSAISDVNAEMLLVRLSQAYAFSILLPIGLFMYAFKFSRGAGAALIAIAVGFYIVHPLTIVFFENMLMPQVDSVGGMRWMGAPPQIDTGVQCDPYEQSWSQINLEREQISNPESFEHIIFLALVRSIFATIVKLIIVLTFIRVFASLLGGEIDVSALARVS